MTGMVLSAGISLTGCTQQAESHVIKDAVQSNSSFYLSGISDHTISKAYIICQYSDTRTLVELGFDPDDLVSIDNDPYAWEALTGIGIIHEGKTPPYVEWFSPKEINACPGKTQSETEIDPHGAIKVSKEERQLDGTDFQVSVLHAPAK